VAASVKVGEGDEVLGFFEAVGDPGEEAAALQPGAASKAI